MFVVSACLAGKNCRYDAGTKTNEKVVELVQKGLAVPVCPEELGGLGTPRIPAEIKDDKVLNKNGEDVTKQFKKGAYESLKIAKAMNCSKAILKSRSASCGCGTIYDGSFSGKLIKGDGIFTKLLKENSFEVMSDEDI